ncbi:hypothetical protein CXB51_011424 [Gossypium anomalum]|uniref:UDP-glycosyltransferases domain-containing protein n=1 Tax=Gossypium anomalum TaxID=47600 RepID=A0A8J6D3S4_9ROSI|nr:hypothetical protein CXB51_011424 [Gossypium anomalum]
MLPPIYSLGPLNLLLNHQVYHNDCKQLRSNLWKEDPICLEWLDSKQPNSVVYVNFVVITVMTPEQLTEFACGLANSNHSFCGGWNSTIESISFGVPMIWWPFFADQQTNCWFSCTRWGIAMEINSDVKRDDVAGHVRELMEGEKGKAMKKKALEWKKMAEETTNTPDGSSYDNLNHIINQGLLH